MILYMVLLSQVNSLLVGAGNGGARFRQDRPASCVKERLSSLVIGVELKICT